jgi:hypothetical protein
MATVTNITTTYAGEFAGKYVSLALLSGNTLSNGLIEIKPNIKFKEVLKVVAIDGITANASCDFADTSTVTLTEKVIQPKELKVNLELCKTPFQSDWEAISMGFSAFDNLPKTFSDYFIAQLSAKVAEKTEQDIWRGVAGAGSFDGFATLLAADAAVLAGQKITAIAGGVNASNVIAELGKIVDKIPSTLYGNEELFVYVSQNIFRAYKRALGGFQASGLGGNGFMAMGNNQDIDIQYFDGVKLVIANGLNDNKAVAALKSNLFFGTGLLSDYNEVKLIDMADIDGSKNVRFVMCYTAAVQYAIPTEIITYGI